MQRYETKPAEVEAVQWDGSANAAGPIIDWILENGGTANFYCPDLGACENDKHTIRIKTIDGNTAEVMPHWWIIMGTEGEFYPCRDDIFAAKYSKKAA